MKTLDFYNAIGDEAKNYGENFKYNTIVKGDLAEAFAAGADFGRNQLFKTVWYDANEKPEALSMIIAIDERDFPIGMFSPSEIKKLYKDWESFVENTGCKKYAIFWDLVAI